MPSILSPVAPILALNKEGVQLLEKMQYSKATTAFSNAIAELKKVLYEKKNFSSLDLGSGQEKLVFSFDLSLSAAAEEAAESDEPFVFDNPIQVSSQRIAGSSSSPSMNESEMLKTLSFALVFNLALGFHQSALYHKTSTTSMLKIQKRFLKALAFYKLALGMYENGEVSLGVMEAIAIANNEAHIYTTVNEPELAEDCYQQVLSHIMYAADKGHKDKILHFERFFSNVAIKPYATARAA